AQPRQHQPQAVAPGTPSWLLIVIARAAADRSALALVLFLQVRLCPGTPPQRGRHPVFFALLRQLPGAPSDGADLETLAAGPTADLLPPLRVCQGIDFTAVTALSLDRHEGTPEKTACGGCQRGTVLWSSRVNRASKSGRCRSGARSGSLR